MFMLVVIVHILVLEVVDEHSVDSSSIDDMEYMMSLEVKWSIELPL